MEIRKVFRSGNSLVVSLPKEVVDVLSIKEGQHLTFEIKGNGVVVRHQQKPRNIETLRRLVGCLKDHEDIANAILSLRDEEDREVEPLE